MAKRKRTPFWRRQAPPKRYDIARLRPSSLPKKDRFESVIDAKTESVRSETVLGSIAGGRIYADFLSECRAQDYRCDKPFCPICARRFRRWFIGELLRITADASNARIFTVLLQSAPCEDLQALDEARYKNIIRKRLKRAGLQKAVVIGGFEIAYKASRRVCVLHANLLVIGGERSAREGFAASFSGGKFARPVVGKRVRDRPKQLSYLLKFTTYHRPYKQSGPSRSKPVPLNGPQHFALVKWMANCSFPDFLFLFNARRAGQTIRI